MSHSLDRRRFLTVSAATVSGALLAACNANPEQAARLLDAVEGKNEILERGLFRHDAMDRVPASAKLAGNDFPKYFISDRVPVWDPAVNGAWRLEVSGAVRRPVTLSLADLMKLPRVTQKVDHFCVEGWNARATWSGVRVSDLARVVEPTADARYVDFAGFDKGYHESWDIESAMHPHTLVAYGMDGHLLGPAHGAPARVHSPVKLGYKNTKYLTRIVFMPQRNGGYWSDQGYEWYGGT
jgi:DMSO/TMAO reductase YedYZ molybdopterin-dependent catalytic subunit